jgi:hypothetical protein
MSREEESSADGAGHASEAPTLAPPAGAPEAETIAPQLAAEPITVSHAGTSATAQLERPALPGYEILGELGRGGMGVVYRARHLVLNRVVALKMILAGGHAGGADLARFLAEAEAVAHLQHPNIVQIHESGQHGGLPYFTLEFVPGGSLADKVREAPLPPKEAAHVVEQLARGMAYAHERGVVHRDLKPENVLLAEDGTPKVTDFGLAKRVEGGSGLTQTGAVMGTPSYMAPEQASGQGKAVGPAADIYALGAVLYRLLTGRPPFQAATQLETILQVVADEPVAPTRLNAKVPRDLETICLKSLQKQPGKRYASAAALAEDLRRYQAGEPIAARPVTFWERSWKWVRRHPAQAAVYGLALAVAFLGLVGGGIAWRWQEAETASALAEAARRQEETLRQQAESAGRQAVEANEKTQVALKNEQEALRHNAEARKLLEKANARAEWLVYAGKIAQAQSAWRENDARLARDTLDECRWDFRGWEHDYLWTLFNSNQQTFLGHTNYVTSVAFSPDGQRLVSGSQDKTLKVWDAQTGRDALTLKGHTGWVWSVAFSPDGKRLVSGGDDDTLKLWDAQTGQHTLTLKGHTFAVTSVAFSPDGKRLVSGSQDKTLKVWDAQTGQDTLTL